MKRRIIKSIISFALCAAIAISPMGYSDVVSAASTVTVTGTQNAATAREVLELVNQERSAQGLNNLYMSEVLEKAAQQRAMELAVSATHERPDGSECYTAIKELGVTYKTAGENIADGSGSFSANKVMSMWMNSTVHKGNILGSTYTHVGIACFKSGDNIYYVQMFASGLSDTTLAAETGEDGIEVTAKISTASSSTSDSNSSNTGSSKPAKVNIKKTSTYVGSKIKLKVTIKKVSGASGYQIAVYNSKKNAKAGKKTVKKKQFKGKTVSLSINKNSKNSKLFVRVRAYSKSGSTKTYGKWSKIKKIKISA